MSSATAWSSSNSGRTGQAEQALPRRRGGSDPSLHLTGCRLALIDRSAKRLITCCALTVGFTQQPRVLKCWKPQGQQILAFRQSATQIKRRLFLALLFAPRLPRRRPAENSRFGKLKFAVLAFKFPVPSTKFPASSSREFCCKQLNSLVDWLVKSQQGLCFHKIPCSLGN
jgi:hypothetical protein